MFTSEFNCDKMFLHAYSLVFTHPFTNKKISITANFPTNWHTITSIFNWNLP